MFESRRGSFRRTVKEEVSNSKWEGCAKLVGKSNVHCLGFIQGSNSYGEFTALVADDGTNYYIPRWYNESFRPDNFSDDELDYLMSGQTITVTQREFERTQGKKSVKQYTYDIKIGDYQM